MLAEGKYSSVDNLIEQAWIIQDDLTRDYYGDNSFDIGDFEPSVSGVLKKAPQAVIAGMFRPFIWETKNMLMLFSALETSIILFFIIYLLFKISLRSIRSIINKNPLLISILCFCIIMSFMVGLTAANFGALVRYRIPVIPFLVLLIIQIYNTKYEKE